MRCICARHFVFVGALPQAFAIAIAQCHDLCLWTEAQSWEVYMATDSSHTDHTNANLRLVHTVFLSYITSRDGASPIPTILPKQSSGADRIARSHRCRAHRKN